MRTTTLHSPDHYMADLRQVLSQGRKRIGMLIGAGAPTAVHVNQDNNIVDDGSSLIPDVAGLTEAVVDALDENDQSIVETLKNEINGCVNIETILTQVRRLAQAIGTSLIHGLNGDDYGKLGRRICEKIGHQVCPSLPDGPNPYSELVSWIAGTQREHSVEIFTPNYDLLIEEAFERSRVAYFDGFAGSHKPFFDPASVSSDLFPARWSLLWKLHGSLGWEVSGHTVIRTGQKTATKLIYPDHLKYDQVTRLPYSALFERLRRFLTTPDTLLIVSGFSFLDSHICAVLDEALAANAHTAILAFQYQSLNQEGPAMKLASSRPNMSVYTRDGAVINGVAGRWKPGQPANEDWQDIRRTFWCEASRDAPAEFLLGDFAKLAQFLALTRAQQVSSPVSDQDYDDEKSSERPTRAKEADA